MYRTLGVYRSPFFVHGRRNRCGCPPICALVQSPAYWQVFPRVRIRQDSQVEDHWRATRGGIVYATGTPIILIAQRLHGEDLPG